MNVATAKKMLAGLDHPTTAARLNKRLEAIAAGRGAHKPTAAHPYRDCFSETTHTHWTSGRVTYGYDRHEGSKRYADAYGERVSCVEHIARSEGRRDWAVA